MFQRALAISDGCTYVWTKKLCNSSGFLVRKIGQCINVNTSKKYIILAWVIIMRAICS